MKNNIKHTTIFLFVLLIVSIDCYSFRPLSKEKQLELNQKKSEIEKLKNTAKELNYKIKDTSSIEYKVAKEKEIYEELEKKHIELMEKYENTSEFAEFCNGLFDAQMKLEKYEDAKDTAKDLLDLENQEDKYYYDLDNNKHNIIFAMSRYYIKNKDFDAAYEYSSKLDDLEIVSICGEMWQTNHIMNELLISEVFVGQNLFDSAYKRLLPLLSYPLGSQRIISYDVHEYIRDVLLMKYDKKTIKDIIINAYSNPVFIEKLDSYKKPYEICVVKLLGSEIIYQTGEFTKSNRENKQLLLNSIITTGNFIKLFD